MKTFFITTASIIFLLLIMVLPTWYDFSQTIQERVLSGIIKYQIEYQEIDVLDDKKTIREKMYNNLNNTFFLFSRMGKAKESEHQYKLALYEILGYSNLCTDGCPDIPKLNEIVEIKRDIWLNDLLYFVDNDMYAMLNTL